MTVDGNPLHRGWIEFYPSAGVTGPVAGGVIEDGYYYIPGDKGPVVGQNRVEINGSVKTGAPQLYPREDAERSRFLTPEDLYRIRGVRPLDFELDGPLVTEIQVGHNVFDFPLRSK